MDREALCPLLENQDIECFRRCSVDFELDSNAWSPNAQEFHSGISSGISENASVFEGPFSQDLCLGGRLLVRYNTTSVGRRVRASKLRHVWNVQSATQASSSIHPDLSGGEVPSGVGNVLVELKHSRFSGKKQVFVNGECVFTNWQRLLTWSFDYAPLNARISLRSDGGVHALRCEEIAAGVPALIDRRSDSDSADSDASLPLPTEDEVAVSSWNRNGHRNVGNGQLPRLPKNSPRVSSKAGRLAPVPWQDVGCRTGGCSDDEAARGKFEHSWAPISSLPLAQRRSLSMPDLAEQSTTSSEAVVVGSDSLGPAPTQVCGTCRDVAARTASLLAEIARLRAALVERDEEIRVLRAAASTSIMGSSPYRESFVTGDAADASLLSEVDVEGSRSVGGAIASPIEGLSSEDEDSHSLEGMDDELDCTFPRRPGVPAIVEAEADEQCWSDEEGSLDVTHCARPAGGGEASCQALVVEPEGPSPLAAVANQSVSAESAAQGIENCPLRSEIPRSARGWEESPLS